MPLIISSWNTSNILLICLILVNVCWRKRWLLECVVSRLWHAAVCQYSDLSERAGVVPSELFLFENVYFGLYFLALVHFQLKFILQLVCSSSHTHIQNTVTLSIESPHRTHTHIKHIRSQMLETVKPPVTGFVSLKAAGETWSRGRTVCSASGAEPCCPVLQQQGRGLIFRQRARKECLAWVVYQ